MKTIFTIALLFFGLSVVAQSPSTSQNYVMETVVKVAGKTSVPMLSGLPVNQVNRTVQYFDGLGRPLQTVQWQGSPTGKDLVQVTEYDAFGREAKKYLPYAEQTGNDGSYKPSGISTQGLFYQPGGGWDGNSKKTLSPFSLTKFEPSPLNRVERQGFPGDDWQPTTTPGTEHTARMSYGTNNTDYTNNTTTGFAVRLFRAEIGSPSDVRTLSRIGYYGAGELYLTISKDENWKDIDGKAGTVEEYKDKEGRVVLKRSFNQKSGIEVLSTYYVYDDFGNLSFVLPPGSDPDAGMPTGTLIDNFCYQYRYDGRRRLIEKKVPGKGWEHMVYNNLDQLVLSQDANQRNASQWLFTKYDALGRTVNTGVINSSDLRSTMQSTLNAQSDGIAPDYPLWETRGLNSDYSDVAFPSSAHYTLTKLTVNYYDRYDFPGSEIAAYQYAQKSSMTQGLSTGSLVNVLGTTHYLLHIIYYDDQGRVKKSFNQHYLGGTVNASNYDELSNTWSFDGKLENSERIHIANSNTTTIADSYTYDHMGRKKTNSQHINGASPTLLSELFYNELGQLKEKKLHNGLQTTAYGYNERGWLQSSNSSEFSIALGYNNGSTPQYNGNISTQTYTNGSSNIFSYSYDKLNRLLNASAGNNLGEQISYDLMGNITGLIRDGYGSNSYHTYQGNQLMGISGFTNAAYTYDENGNLKTDNGKGITLGYNYLSLPTTITGAVNIAYTYDAMGNKLRKHNVLTSETIDYVNGIQYTNGVIDFIHTDEGIARKNGSNYSYDYNLSDHLGNVRATFYQNPTTNQLEVLQRDDYYAFGLRKSTTFGNNKYLYNGKELQQELEQYDYGARVYDPLIGRWNVVDPKAELGRRFSPYNYAFNNPIRFIDPDGMWPWPNPWSSAQSLFNNTVAKVQSTYSRAEVSVKSTYNQASKAVSDAGTAAKKLTVENKEALISTAKGMQDFGDKTAVVGAVAAVAGAPIAVVGAAPGTILATAGKGYSLAGVVLEVVVEMVAGSGKNAAITGTNEAVYRGIGLLGSKAIDNIIPGPTPNVSGQIIEGLKQAVGLFESGLKKETDKTVDKFKD